MQLARPQPGSHLPRYLLIAGIVAAALLGLALWPAPRAVPAAQAGQALALKASNKTDRLIANDQETLRTQPDNANVAAQLGLAYLQKVRETGDPSYYPKAEQVFASALAHDPQQLDALVGKGTLLLAQHRFQDALQVGEQAKNVAPRIPRIYGVIADAQTELGQYDAAVATIQTMVDMRPDLSSYSRVSYARELHGDMNGAIEAMSMALRAGGPTSEATEWTRYQLATLYFNIGDLTSAERLYEEALVRIENYVPALAGMARIRAAQGKMDQAIDLYQQAIARMPLPEYVIALGELHEARGDGAAAEQQYALVRAMQQLFKSAGQNTDMELALFEADHSSDPAAALALAQTAYAQRPSTKAADTLAWALFKANKLDEAQQHMTEALRLGSKDPLLLYHGATIAASRNDRAQAKSLLTTLLTTTPHFSPLLAPKAQQLLDTLR